MEISITPSPRLVKLWHWHITQALRH